MENGDARSQLFDKAQANTNIIARQYKQTHDTKQRQVLGGCGDRVSLKSRCALSPWSLPRGVRQVSRWAREAVSCGGRRGKVINEGKITVHTSGVKRRTHDAHTCAHTHTSVRVGSDGLDGVVWPWCRTPTSGRSAHSFPARRARALGRSHPIGRTLLTYVPAMIKRFQLLDVCVKILAKSDQTPTLHVSDAHASNTRERLLPAVLRTARRGGIR